MNKQLNIAILDDHQIVIDGLKLLLSDHHNFNIIAEFTRGIDLIQFLKINHVDIVLSDIMMPDMDGFEVATHIKTNFPHIKVLALSMNGDGMLIEKMIEDAHIEGYLLKTTDKNELLLALDEISEGRTYFAPEILEELNNYQKIKKENDLIHLTSRELDIIKCIAKDKTNKQIADELFISERTVETHRKNIFRKTGVHTAISLIEFAKNRKFID